MGVTVALMFAMWTILSFSNSYPSIGSPEAISSGDYDFNEQDSPSSETSDITNTTKKFYMESLNSTNGSAHNLYVIKAVVYEIGILTDVADNDTEDNVQNEQVDLTFFKPDINGSVIDLNNIPFPIQANISGQVATGIAPVNFGTIVNPHLDLVNITNNEDITDAQNLNISSPLAYILSPSDTLASNTKIDSEGN